MAWLINVWLVHTLPKKYDMTHLYVTRLSFIWNSPIIYTWLAYTRLIYTWLAAFIRDSPIIYPWLAYHLYVTRLYATHLYVTRRIYTWLAYYLSVTRLSFIRDSPHIRDSPIRSLRYITWLIHAWLVHTLPKIYDMTHLYVTRPYAP